METNNLILHHLRAMRNELIDLKGTFISGQRHTNERLSAIEHHMAAFHISTHNHSEEIEELKSRTHTIEKRLNLHDPNLDG